MLKKIMVPVDGSKHASRAVALASELALWYGAELIVLHVMKKVGSSRVPRELEYYARMEHINVTELVRFETVANQIVAWAVSVCAWLSCHRSIRADVTSSSRTSPAKSTSSLTAWRYAWEIPRELTDSRSCW